MVGGELPDSLWSLTDSYGYYGLPWLETILRLADHGASREIVRSAGARISHTGDAGDQT